jgi:hypothetical protein
MSIHFTSAIVPHGLVTCDEWIIARHLFFYTIPLVFVPRLESPSSSFSPRIFLGSVLRFYIPYHLSTYPHILRDVKYGVHEGRWLPSTQRRPSFRLPIRHCFSALSPVFPAAMPSQIHNATVYGSYFYGPCFSPCWASFQSWPIVPTCLYVIQPGPPPPGPFQFTAYRVSTDLTVSELIDRIYVVDPDRGPVARGIIEFIERGDGRWRERPESSGKRKCGTEIIGH